MHRAISTAGKIVQPVEISKLMMVILRIILFALAGIILIGIGGGVVKIFLDLHQIVSEELDTALRHILTNVLMLLAIVEIFNASLTYFTDGRVKVTYIVDTVLVVMLSEMITLWFKGGRHHALCLLDSLRGDAGADPGARCPLFPGYKERFKTKSKCQGNKTSIRRKR